MSKDKDGLLEAVQEIAEIIYMEMPLRYQDEWLSDIIVRGIWTPDDDMVYKDGVHVGACCRNGCEKCEK
jgi:hypothetical protein